MSTSKYLRDKAELALGIIDAYYFGSADLSAEDVWAVRSQLKDALREAGSDLEWLMLFTDSDEPEARA